MGFDAVAAYNELHPHFQGRIRRNEPLARHCTFGADGPADVWISLETQKELIGLDMHRASYREASYIILLPQLKENEGGCLIEHPPG
jgi:hypothetical protein